jgi:hypothetical protein
VFTDLNNIIQTMLQFLQWPVHGLNLRVRILIIMMNLNWKALLVVASLSLGTGLVACDSGTTPPAGTGTAPGAVDAPKSGEPAKAPEPSAPAPGSMESPKSGEKTPDAMGKPKDGAKPDAMSKPKDGAKPGDAPKSLDGAPKPSEAPKKP